MKKEDKPLYKRWSFWLIALLVVGLFGNLLPDSDVEVADDPPKAEVEAESKPDKPAEDKAVEPAKEPEEEKPKPKPEPVVEKPATIESVIAEVVSESNYVSHHTDIADTLAMTIELSDNLTKNWVVLSAYDQLLEITEKLRQESLVDENTALHYIFQTDLIDEYGNTSKGNVIIVNLSAETLAKINFDNVKSESIPDIADIHFVHPSLK